MDARKKIKRASRPPLRLALFFFLVFALIFMLFAFIPGAASRNAYADTASTKQITPGSITGDSEHYLGLQPSPVAADECNRIVLPQSLMLPLAASADLSSELPPVGDQQSQNSCVAWATSYYYKSVLETKEHTSWDLTNPYYQFSPSFVYNQINGGKDNGTSFLAAFALLENLGDVDISEMPYDEADYLTQPTTSQLEAAKPYRIPNDWAYFWAHSRMGAYSSSNDISSIKAWLSAGNILVMGIPIYYDFPAFSGNPASPYYDYDGTSEYAGGHGVCICGYNDNANPSGIDADHRGGFKMVNSWGPAWNGASHGYVYLSYDFVKRYAWEAWAMSDLAPDSPHVTYLSPVSGLPGDTIHIYGKNFGTLRRSAGVSFNGTAATSLSFSDGDITVAVPAGATTGPVAVYDWEGKASNSPLFAAGSMEGYFTVNASISGGNGTVDEIIQLISSGEAATVHINPDGGYAISSIADNGAQAAPANPYVIESVTADHNVVVAFESTTLTVNARVEGGHGSVVETTQQIDRGGTATINIDPDPGYHISSIVDNGSSMAVANPYLIADVQETHDVVIAFASEPVGAESFYFAEGCTRPGFDEWLCLLNAGDNPAMAHITYMFTDGSTTGQDVQVGAAARATVKVNEVVGSDRDVSIKIACDTAMVAERPMYFDYNGAWTGGHDVVGATQPLQVFYFAEGCTKPGFDQWLCIMNPGEAPANARVTYMFSDGTTQIQDVYVGATTRSTIKVNDVVGSNKDVSMKITSDSPIVAERPIYFNYKGVFTGGHDVIGAASPQYSSYFAEGCTRQGFDEWLCLMNPGDFPATAHVTYVFSDGSSIGRDVGIGATSRSTVLVNDIVGPGKDVSIKISSDQPIVAERPMYFNYNGAWTGGHDVIGVNTPASSSYFAEGYTGSGFDEWLCLMNPSDSPTTVHVTYIYADGSSWRKDITISASSRSSIYVNDAAGSGKNVSAKITSDSPIVAERPMYFNYNGMWTGGHDVVGYTPS